MDIGVVVKQFGEHNDDAIAYTSNKGEMQKRTRPNDES